MNIFDLMRHSIKWFFAIWIWTLTHIADAQTLGIPFVQNYTKQTYLSGNQNWAISKDTQGVMYFGNNQGLLVFDGNYWQTYAMPNHQIVRSVLAAHDGHIYVGAFAEFGYWSLKNHQFTYTSLLPYLPKNIKINDEIWKIYQTKDAVIFQSFSAIYIYKNQKIEVIKRHSPYLFLHQVGQKLWIESLSEGLFELRGKELIPLKNDAAFKPKNVLSILPFKDGKLLIGTEKQGLFLFNGRSFQPFKTTFDAFLQQNQLNNGVKISENLYAFGTIGRGSIWMDSLGRNVQMISKKIGLQNNTILSLFTDHQNLWMGLDNGIDRISLHTPISYYADNLGSFGTVYASAFHNDKLYLGTNQGLFYTSQKQQKDYTASDFTLIPGSEGQVWSLQIFDNELICGHNNGTYRVNDTQFEKISTINGGWVLQRLIQNPTYLIQGNYTGLAFYKKNNSGKYEFSHQLQGFSEPAKYVEQDTDGAIWVSQAYKGLYRIYLDESLHKIKSQTSFGKKQGLPNTFNVNLSKRNGKLYFGTTEGIYTFKNEKFELENALQKALGSYAFSCRMIPQQGNAAWVLSKSRLARITFNTNRISVDSSSFSALDGQMIQFYENLHALNPKQFLISIDNGFAIFDTQYEPAPLSPTLPKVLIRKVEDVSSATQRIAEFVKHTLNLSSSQNNLRISYAFPVFKEEKVQFQYYLQGYSQYWSEWNYLSAKDFTNLSPGNYTFSVRAKINNQISEITYFKFNIATPWYLTKWAYAFYFIVTIILLYIVVKRYDKQIKIKHLAKFKQQAAEKERLFKRDAELAEQAFIKLKAEKLQADLDAKNRELSNTAMTLVYKNELLQKLSEEIESLKNKENDKPITEKVKRIQKVITDAKDDQHDWDLFESSFNEAHEGFFKRLKQNYPKLVPNDLKICAFLRMNMSSKEMASLLNISVRGVEIKRYRLRKKLELSAEKNLVTFLMEY